MWGKKGQSKKKDPKKIATALRQSIAGEPLVTESVKGFDLSKLTIDQLNALWKIKQDDSLSDDEKQKEWEKVLSDGTTPITGMKFKDSGEVVMGRKKFTWFNTDQQIVDDKDDPGPFSWQGHKRVPSWCMDDPESKTESTPKPVVTDQQVAPKKSFAQKLQGLFTKHDEETLVPEGKKGEAPVVEMKAKEGSQEYLKLKMEEMEKEFAVNLEAHERAETLRKANADLNTYISKIL